MKKLTSHNGGSERWFRGFTAGVVAATTHRNPVLGVLGEVGDGCVGLGGCNHGCGWLGNHSWPHFANAGVVNDEE